MTDGGRLLMCGLRGRLLADADPGNVLDVHTDSGCVADESCRHELTDILILKKL